MHLNYYFKSSALILQNLPLCTLIVINIINNIISFSADSITVLLFTLNKLQNALNILVAWNIRTFPIDHSTSSHPQT